MENMEYYYSDVIVDIVVYIDDILIICSVIYIYIQFYTYPSQHSSRESNHEHPAASF